MATNYATKYSTEVDERFALASLTQGAFNTQYDWTGVQSVRVYSVPTSPMNNYSRNGVSRYGNVDELQNSVQELVLSQDRSFTFTIDRGNFEDMAMHNAAGEALSRQIEEVVVPEIDIYNIAQLAQKAGKIVASPISKINAYDAFLEADMHLSEKKVPNSNRIAFVSPTYYKMLKLDDSFVKCSDISKEMVVNGVVGMVDNVRIVRVPSTYLPSDVEFVMVHKICAAAPVKLCEYKIHTNPPGISGWLVEGRVCFDCFVLDNKTDAIYLHKSI